ncbi:MAG TPA: co-chaperone GroES [Caldilineae bacterium]|nr:co-chaperone GroES [Caldilineae bacterium]
MRIEPLGDRVLVKVIEEASRTASGILLPETAKEKPQRGEVVAVGDGEDIPVEVGDQVLYAKYSGTEIRLNGTEHLILDVGDILAKIKE